MNARTLVNLLLLILLGSMISFFIYKAGTKNQVTHLTQLNIDQVKKITIPKEEGEDIVLVRNNTWHMTKPYNIKAHQFRVNTLLGISQIPINKTYDAKDLKLTDYALQPPRARIQFDDTTIKYGKTNPVTGMRYLQHNNRVALVLDDTYPLVSAQPTTFIDLYLFDKADRISSITIPAARVYKTPNELWASNPANVFTADQVQALIVQWKNLQAFAVHKYMPRKDTISVEIVTESTTVTYELFHDDNWLILGRQDIGIEYHLDGALKDKLLGLTNA